MIKIGDKEVVLSTTLVIPDDETAIIEKRIEDWDVKIALRFLPKDADNILEAMVDGDTFIINFNGWNDVGGTALKKIFKIGTTNSNRNLGMLVYHHKIGNMNRLDFQLLLGGQNE